MDVTIPEEGALPTRSTCAKVVVVVGGCGGKRQRCGPGDLCEEDVFLFQF